MFSNKIIIDIFAEIEKSHKQVMKLTTSVEYFTRWGEELFLRSGNRIYPMQYSPGGIWTAEVGRLSPGQTFRYRYELHSGGLCRRTEWNDHTVTMPSGGRKPVEMTGNS